ncbi:unnamed protein product [Pocillopora meandrina]|uniref:Uncharacterized protein n=1 Tax=Pocillopora meandrina TaxID=46732 RepID=A0AAU9W4C0_9CNID|nr:unnamed protein product [Pocillopora meandrina]
MNVLWAIIWFLVLWFLAWPVGFFCAGWYVCLSPIEACVDAIKAVTELLMKGVMLPLEVAKHMVEGKAGCDCGSGLSEKLQKLQNHAARILMCTNYDSDIDELFRVLSWRKLKYQRFESAAVMMYKSLHGMTPEYLSSRFVFRNDITSYR